MSTRIESTQHVQTQHESNRVERPDEKSDNAQLMVPASYAAVGGTFELLMLMLEASKAQKDSLRETRVATEASISQVQAGQVDDIRAKASLQLVGSVATGSMSIAGNTMSTAGAVRSIEARDYSNQASSLQRGVQQESRMSAATSLEVDGTRLKSAGELMTGTAATMKGLFESAGTSREADSTEKQHRADVLKRSAERLSSELDGLNGNEDKLISYARDIEAAKARCTQIALQTR